MAAHNARWAPPRAAAWGVVTCGWLVRTCRRSTDTPAHAPRAPRCSLWRVAIYTINRATGLFVHAIGARLRLCDVKTCEHTHTRQANGMFCMLFGGVAYRGKRASLATCAFDELVQREHSIWRCAPVGRETRRGHIFVCIAYPTNMTFTPAKESYFDLGVHVYHFIAGKCRRVRVLYLLEVDPTGPRGLLHMRIHRASLLKCRLSLYTQAHFRQLWEELVRRRMVQNTLRYADSLSSFMTTLLPHYTCYYTYIVYTVYYTHSWNYVRCSISDKRLEKYALAELSSAWWKCLVRIDFHFLIAFNVRRSIINSLLYMVVYSSLHVDHRFKHFALSTEIEFGRSALYRQYTYYILLPISCACRATLHHNGTSQVVHNFQQMKKNT